MHSFSSAANTTHELAAQGYVADDALSLCVFLAVKMGRPLFLEGAPGVGKTELAKVISLALDTELIRLQCYEGLDLSQAAYEWNYLRQLLEIQTHEPAALTTENLFAERNLLKRPLLRAIDPARDRAPVLLLDELDRADEEFESFLLELLSDFQITIPELGTIRATHRPIVILTSNRTREVHDALKRRCIYHYLGYPSFATELAILVHKVPTLDLAIAKQVVGLCQRLRDVDLYKRPGIAETLDWAEALRELAIERLDARTFDATLGFILKHRDDMEHVRGPVGQQLLEAAASG